MDLLITIGLEIHLKLATERKLFCPCKNDQSLIDNTPNSNICPICFAEPGALPQLNAEAVKKALMLANIFQAEISNPSFFDRKSYFYPDLPSGYQITQFYHPIISKGKLHFFLEDFSEEKIIGITEAHLESDTAKSTHLGDEMLLDFNRAGTPLIEIVTAPDFHSAEEAVAFAREIQKIAKYNQISDADMEKGQMRVDVNISIRYQETDPLGTRVELKNISSFAAIKRAIEHEAARQHALIQAGEAVSQETRRWDDLAGESFAMRSKADAVDYKYFPEPDLGALEIEQSLLDEINQMKFELPYEKIKIMKSEYGFHKEYIHALIGDQEILHYFFSQVEAGIAPQLVAKWIAGPISAYLTQHVVSLEQLPISLAQLSAFLKVASEGKVLENQLKVVMEEMLARGVDAELIIKEKGFDQPGIWAEELEAIVQKVLASSPENVTLYRGGKLWVLWFFVGQVMKETAGKADPKVVNELLVKYL